MNRGVASTWRRLLSFSVPPAVKTRKLATVELSCSAWPEPILICQGYDDITCMTEDGRLRSSLALSTYRFRSETTAEPQNVGFAIDNVTGFAQQRINEALEAGEYVDPSDPADVPGEDLTAPAERPYRMRVKTPGFEGLTVQVEAGYYDLIINRRAAPHLQRQRVPGLKYWPLIPCRTDGLTAICLYRGRAGPAVPGLLGPDAHSAG
ncbi:DUF1833 family protein [Pseudomonas aeruginosa]